MSSPEKRTFDLRDLAVVGVAIGSLLVADRISSLENRVSELEKQQQMHPYNAPSLSGSYEVDASCLKIAVPEIEPFSPNYSPEDATTTTTTTLPQSTQQFTTTTAPKVIC